MRGLDHGARHNLFLGKDTSPRVAQIVLAVQRQEIVCLEMPRSDAGLPGKIVISAHHADGLRLIQDVGVQLLVGKTKAVRRKADVIETVQEAFAYIMRSRCSEYDVNVGMALLKRRDDLRQYTDSERRRAGHAKQPGAGSMDQSDRLLDFLQTGKIALHGFEQLCRLRRRLQTPAAELEQLQLGGRLDLTEQPADRRLRGVQHFRG